MPATDSGAQKARDAMSYKIMVEDGEQETVLSQSDASMTEAFAKLLAWLQRRDT
jgi:hypothetical protein